METKNLIFGLAIAVLSYIIVDFLRPKGNAPQEPPKLQPTIPFIGHVIGMAQKGARYIGSTGVRTKQPIFALDFLASRIYIVNSSTLVASIQRNSKTISFDPFIDAAADRMAGISPSGLTVLSTDHPNVGSVNKQIVKAMHPSLLGPGLDVMNLAMIGNLCKSIDELERFAEEGKVFDLNLWVRHGITVASSEAVWGQKNPFRDPEVEDAFWDFDSEISGLLPKILPTIIAKKAYYGREKTVQAFVRYYNSSWQTTASDLAKARWNVQSSAGATVEDIARLEVSMAIGVLSNTSPSSFWTLFEIFSRPALLAQLREEVAQNALVQNEQECQIDLAAIKDKCPLLLSTFQEVLRYHSTSAPLRFITSDTTITNPVTNEPFLLKKGKMLFMPSRNMNFEKSIWGDDSDDFNPKRFEKEILRQRPSSFMSFGASPSLCPGRHFASGEILGLAAMMILRFEVESAGGGKWEKPDILKGAVAASMPAVDGKVPVKCRVREEFKGKKWGFGVTEGKGKFALITG